LLATIGVAGALLALVSSGLGASDSTVNGTVRGKASTMSGSVFGQLLNPVNPARLPPGDGGAATLNFTAGEGRLTVTSQTATTSCTGAAIGTTSINAVCFSRIQGLSVKVDGEELLRATEVHARSESTSDGTTTQSHATVLTVDGLCVVQAPGGPCVPVSLAPGVSVPVAGSAATGAVTGLLQVARQTDQGLGGSGLEVTALRLTLQLPALGDVYLDLGKADSFVGAVQSCASIPFPTSTPTPAQAPTMVVPTPTCVPPPTSTPTPTRPPMIYRDLAPALSKD
jgi:hypothetical protein